EFLKENLKTVFEKWQQDSKKPHSVCMDTQKSIDDFNKDLSFLITISQEILNAPQKDLTSAKKTSKKSSRTPEKTKIDFSDYIKDSESQGSIEKFLPAPLKPFVKNCV